MNRKRFLIYIILVLTVWIVPGCSRRSINRQIAESIGTLGMYEDDEPVESPKMKADKQMQETKEKIELEVATHIENAEKKAVQYDYAGALEELDQINEDYQDDARVTDSKIAYQKLNSKLTYHEGSIAHFSVDNLIVDKQRAFYDPEMGYDMNNWHLTTEEFRNILQQLYDNDYILMDIQDIVSETEDEKDNVVMTWEGVLVPEGKKPIVLSFTAAGYGQDYTAYGVSGRMVIDETDGKVKNEYTDASGNVLIGAYDVVPIVEEFLEKHPDFSLHGARGILSITGCRGAFGYNPKTDGDTITAIAEKLKSDGWTIACQGYRGASLESELDSDEFVEDMENWNQQIGQYVGSTDMLIYSNGDELPLYAFKHMWALEHGYHYFFSQWASSDSLSVYDDCLMQSRRLLNGYDLYFYGEDMEQYFDHKKILDKERPAFE